MDLYKAIQELYAEKQRLEAAIASLEQLLKTKRKIVGLRLEGLKSRRGRKSMSAEERREVSARMKKYWAQRRTVVAKTSARG